MVWGRCAASGAGDAAALRLALSTASRSSAFSTCDRATIAIAAICASMTDASTASSNFRNGDMFDIFWLSASRTVRGKQMLRRHTSRGW